MEKTCGDSTWVWEHGAETEANNSVMELPPSKEDLGETGGSAGRQSRQLQPPCQPRGVVGHLLRNQHLGTLPDDDSKAGPEARGPASSYDSDTCPMNNPHTPTG